jgi:hypothetical protein
VSRLEEAEARMRALEKEIFQLRRFGRDRFVDGDVIRFNKIHHAADDTHKSYSYVSIKVGLYWYLTGQQRRERYTYDELIQFVIQHPVAENVQVATAWVDVAEAADEVRGPWPYTKTGEPNYDILTADMPAGQAPVIPMEELSPAAKFLADPETLR